MTVQRFIRSFDGTSLFTSAAGQGPAVILCDGIGCDGFIWRHLAPVLRQKHQVIHWNYRGHGRSALPKDPKAVSMTALKDDLLAVMNAYDLQSATLCGHSLGVQVIFETALAAPMRVHALVAICGSYGHPLSTLHGSAAFAKLFVPLRAVVQRWPQHSQKLWRQFFSADWVKAYAHRFEVNGQLISAADLAPYFAHLAGMDAELFVAMLDQVQHHTTEDRLSQIKAPTLIVGAEHDTFTPGRLSHHMHATIPGSHLLFIPKTSHVAPLETPHLLAMRLEQFLLQTAST